MYFKLGASIGLICIPIICYMIMGDAAFGLVVPASGKSALGAIILGFLSSIFVGHLFDRRRKRFGSGLKLVSSAVVVPLVIFLSGVTIGGLVNFIINASFLNPSFGLFEEFYDWLFKPLFWLFVLGAPISVLLGLIYFLAFIRLNPGSRP